MRASTLFVLLLLLAPSVAAQNETQNETLPPDMGQNDTSDGDDDIQESRTPRILSPATVMAINGAAILALLVAFVYLARR